MSLAKLKSLWDEHRYKIIYSIILVMTYKFYDEAFLGVSICLCAYTIVTHVTRGRNERQIYDFALRDGKTPPDYHNRMNLELMGSVAVVIFFIGIAIIVAFDQHDIHWFD